jgi:ribosomal protein S13|tara:strand:+ start:279 stop:563 length:285 start_codon:yes stop_codon:yes gene_type:complete
MSKELSENSRVEVSLKTLGGIGVLIATLVGMWFQLNASIDEAKLLPEPPPPEVTKMEFDMKDQMIRATIMTTQEDVSEIKEDMKYLRNKIDNLQ